MNSFFKDSDMVRRRLLKIGFASLATGLSGCGSSSSGGNDVPASSPMGDSDADVTPSGNEAVPETPADGTNTPSTTPNDPPPDCTLVPTPAFSGGTHYINGAEERVNLTEGRSDPTLELRVRFVDSATCEPLSSLVIDLWGADLDGLYSSNGSMFARGRQLTDANGRVSFLTFYPGPGLDLPPLTRFTALFGSSEAFTSALFMAIEDASEVYGADTLEGRGRAQRATANFATTNVPDALVVDPSGPVTDRVVEFTVAIDQNALSAPPCESGTPDCGEVEADDPVTEPSTPVDGGLPLIDPASAQAQALQYDIVSTVAGQSCGNCALYQGTPGSTLGPCPLFPGRRTRAEAKCSAYVPTA